MADPLTAGPSMGPSGGSVPTRKEKRKALKKLKRKRARIAAAIREREEEERRSNDPEEQRRIRIREEEEAEASERARREFEERERVWIEAAATRKRAEEEEEEDRRMKRLIEEPAIGKNQRTEITNESKESDEWDYIEEGPAEIIWQGNEIIVKKKKVKVAKRSSDRQPDGEDVDRPTSNPLPPQSAAFASYKNVQSATAQEVLESVAQQVPNFGTEQDKAHCPFHHKTGACRFGSRCSRVHFYPDKSCTLLIKNMYNGPGLAWEQDEGLEYTDEEVERSFEEFYEDVHTEFLKFGELVNFKVCKNGSYHLRGNVYVHYKYLESAILAYNSINGRYFAGKQMTCEFVGVTRWKIAICGEYMKSRLKTCSRGTACNFIHCFRNPGGDYEWADWDNPPPKYWIKKMAVLFGPIDESASSKQMEAEGSERPRSRKQSPIHKRIRRSYHEMEVYDSSSGRENANRKRDRCSIRSVVIEHSSSSRREDHNHDPGEDYSMEQDSKDRSIHKRSSEGHRRHGKVRAEDKSTRRKGRRGEASSDEQEDSERKRTSKSPGNHKIRKKHGAEDTFTWQHGEISFDEQGKSGRKLKSKDPEQQSKKGWLSDQKFDYTDDSRVQSSSPTGDDKSYSRYAVDAQSQYSERYYSNDSDSGKDDNSSRHKKRAHERRGSGHYRRNYSNHSNSGCAHKSSRHMRYAHERRDTDRYSSEHCSDSDDGFSSYSSPNGWDFANTHSGGERTRDQSWRNGSSRSYEKHRSGGKKRHHQEKKKRESHFSGSDAELGPKAHKKHIRTSTPTRYATGPVDFGE